MATYTIAVNDEVATRAATVLPLVQAIKADADSDYVYTGAVTVGLNRLYDRHFRFKSADFITTAGTTNVDVEVDAQDEARAASLADSLELTTDVILSAALCVGFEKLVGGTRRLVGPFA